jgi:alpha-1,2-mannosyltransferase
MVRDGEPFGMDLAARGLVEAYRSQAGTRVAAWLTLLGTGPVLYPLLAVLCVVALLRQRNAAEWLPVLALAAGQILELVLFATLHRPAPGAALSPLLTATYSSGRTAAAVLGWGLVVWLSGRLLRLDRRGTVRGSLAVALAMGVVVGATRVYLGAHWLTDAIAGVATGSVLLAVALAGLGRYLGWAGGHARSHPTDLLEDRQPAPGSLPEGHPGWTRVRQWLHHSPWAWLVPALASLVPLVPILLTPPDERMKDLLVYYGAGGSVGAGENIYAFQTVFAMPFTYPPFAALVIEPIARMPLGVAQALWTAATLAAIVAMAGTILRPVAQRIGLPLTVAALLVTSPVRSHFRFGQVGIFLVLIVALDLSRRHRSRWTGWGLGLATAIKLTPAVFLPWLAVSRQWRRLATTLLWVAGATGLGLVLLWRSSGDYLFNAAWDTGRFGANDIPGNQSVRGMLLRSLPEPANEVVWLAVSLVLVAVGTYHAWLCERRGDRLAALGVLGALSIAVSPISWMHHLVWLALPTAALAAAGRFRLVAIWFATLTVSFRAVSELLASAAPSLQRLAGFLLEVPGLTAVAAVLLLPALARPREASQPQGPARVRDRPTTPSPAARAARQDP